jgi:hypothetical protein
MRSLVSVAVIAVLVAVATGCSSKPPPEIDQAVRSRLTRYATAWRQGDAAGVRESFHARDADESRLLAAMSELAPAQATMRTTYEKSLGTLGRMIFGDADPATLVIAPRPWDAFADAAAQPHELVYAKPDVLARLVEKDEDMTLRLRNAGGAWKIDLDAFVMGDDVAQLAAQTQRQVRHTREMTDAMRTKDPARVRQTMLRQVVEVRGPERSVAPPATTTTATTSPATTQAR